MGLSGVTASMGSAGMPAMASESPARTCGVRNGMASVSYPSAIAGFVVGSEHRLRSVTVSAYCLYVVTLTLQNEGCHLRHTRTVVVEQDGGRNVSAQTLRRYRNLLRNPRSIAVWIVVLFLAHVSIDGCLGDEIEIGRASCRERV